MSGDITVVVHEVMSLLTGSLVLLMTPTRPCLQGDIGPEVVWEPAAGVVAVGYQGSKAAFPVVHALRFAPEVDVDGLRDQSLGVMLLVPGARLTTLDAVYTWARGQRR